jgi:hypothetical protein
VSAAFRIGGSERNTNMRSHGKSAGEEGEMREIREYMCENFLYFPQTREFKLTPDAQMHST